MFGCSNDRLFPEKYTVEDHISNTKLEKGDDPSSKLTDSPMYVYSRIPKD